MPSATLPFASAVALHSEGVDRNASLMMPTSVTVKSPSTRRAWIEIWETYWQTEQGWVTLHPEGVDRNLIHDYFFAKSLDVAFHLKGAGRTQIVTLDFWT